MQGLSLEFITFDGKIYVPALLMPHRHRCQLSQFINSTARFRVVIPQLPGYDGAQVQRENSSTVFVTEVASDVICLIDHIKAEGMRVRCDHVVVLIIHHQQ